MRRRDAILALAAAPLAPAVAACSGSRESKPMSDQMPALFAAHGAPMLLEEPDWVAALADWAVALPRPRAILMISAHWDARPTTIGATRPLPLIYDFSGFPAHFYRLTYPSPGAPELAARVRELLSSAGVRHVDDETRGLDHGAYVPLMCMYPAADVPVLQISMPGLDPADLFAIGRALAPLRGEGVLIFGSGFLTHNMRAFASSTPGWARDFDAWAGEHISRLDVDALIDFQAKGPGVEMALPTTEHYVPLLVTMGAAIDAAPQVSFPITGWWYGSFTKRSLQLG